MGYPPMEDFGDRVGFSRHFYEKAYSDYALLRKPRRGLF